MTNMQIGGGGFQRTGKGNRINAEIADTTIRMDLLPVQQVVPDLEKTAFDLRRNIRLREPEAAGIDAPIVHMDVKVPQHRAKTVKGDDLFLVDKGRDTRAATVGQVLPKNGQ